MDDQAVALTEAPEGYSEWLADLKHRIHASRQRAALAVNSEMLSMYWKIGYEILERESDQGWGAKVIDRLSHDLRRAFPDLGGFSRANLKSCAHSHPLGATTQLANRLLANFHGATTLRS